MTNEELLRWIGLAGWGVELEPKRHEYFRGGQRLPGVNEILTGSGIRKPIPDLPHIRAAKRQGSRIHTWLVDATAELQPSDEPFADSLMHRDSDWRKLEVVAHDAVLATRDGCGMPYAGMTDLVCRHRETEGVVLPDVKTIRQAGEATPSAMWQACAYVTALAPWCDADEGFPGRAGVLECYSTGKPARLILAQPEHYMEWVTIWSFYALKRKKSWFRRPRWLDKGMDAEELEDVDGREHGLTPSGFKAEYEVRW